MKDMPGVRRCSGEGFWLLRWVREARQSRCACGLSSFLPVGKVWTRRDAVWQAMVYEVVVRATVTLRWELAVLGAAAPHDASDGSGRA